MSEKGVRRFSVSVPPKLLEDFDKVIKKMGYERSKAIRLAMQNFLTEYRWTSEEERVGVGALVMIYDHETRGLEETLTEIQHEYLTMISSTTHIHLDERDCLEIVAVRGEVKSIQSLAKRLMAERGVKQLKLATLMLQRP
jgi:CopG family nickel-responsive transcriptional regulator